MVFGQVQGVYFRHTCRQVATERRVAGWVRNRPDGAVEAVFEGDPDQVREMVAWAHRGPAMARVDSVEVHEEEPEGLAGFTITR